MIINTDQLIAFLTVSRTKNISRASQEIGLTQAAISIRIQKLEETLGSTLLIRNRTGVIPTEAGLKILKFAETLEDLEKECIGDLRPAKDKKLSGTIRVSCFSTIGRSFVLPALELLLKEHPVDFHYHTKEIRELSAQLQSGEADFIFLDHELKREGVTSILLGHERYVYVKGKHKCEEIFLNHDEDDMMSYRYMEFIGNKDQSLKRRFLDEIYSVIDGVASGIGVSVLPEHLIAKDPRIRIVNPSKALLSPVYLCYKERPYRTKLFEQTLKSLSSISI